MLYIAKHITYRMYTLNHCNIIGKINHVMMSLDSTWPWWRHDTESLSVLLALCKEIWYVLWSLNKHAFEYIHVKLAKHKSWWYPLKIEEYIWNPHMLIIFKSSLQINLCWCFSYTNDKMGQWKEGTPMLAFIVMYISATIKQLPHRSYSSKWIFVSQRTYIPKIAVSTIC